MKLKSPFGIPLPTLAILSSATVITLRAQPISVPLTQPARSEPIGPTFVDWASLVPQETPVGYRRDVFDAPTPTMARFELHISTLNPGKASHPPHHHPWEEILILKEGELDVSINGEKHRARPGAFIFFASHDVHNATNVGDRPATYYVINFYTDASRTVRDQPAAEWAPQDKLRSCVVNWEDLSSKINPDDTRRSIVNSPTLTFAKLEVHGTTVAPGRYPVRHASHPNLLLMIMLKGAMELNVNGVTHLVGEGSIFYMPPGPVQIARNRGGVPATYYVISVFSEDTPRE